MMYFSVDINGWKKKGDGMSMLDVARFLSYSKSVDLVPQGDRFFNLSMVNSGHLFSCLHGDKTHWSFGREETEVMDRIPTSGKKG